MEAVAQVLDPVHSGDKEKSARLKARARSTAPERTLNFYEAASELKPWGIDLEHRLEDTLQQHVRWGLVDWMKRAGVVGSIHWYARLFEGVKFRESTVKQIQTLPKNRSGDDTIFHPGTISPLELWKVLFRTKEKLDESFSGEPVAKASLGVLVESMKSYKSRDEACSLAARKGQPWPSMVGEQPKIEFNGEYLHFTGILPDPHDSIQEIVRKGYGLGDPAMSFLLLREYMDEFIQRRAATFGGSIEKMGRKNYRKHIAEMEEVPFENFEDVLMAGAKSDTILGLHDIEIFPGIIGGFASNRKVLALLSKGGDKFGPALSSFSVFCANLHVYGRAAVRLAIE